MSEIVTKEDLMQFGMQIIEAVRSQLKEINRERQVIEEPEWLKSKAVRKMLDISAGSVQNLRLSNRIRFKKVLGSYYYSKTDLQKLFTDEKA